MTPCEFGTHRKIPCNRGGCRGTLLACIHFSRLPPENQNLEHPGYGGDDDSYAMLSHCSDCSRTPNRLDERRALDLRPEPNFNDFSDREDGKGPKWLG